MCELHIIRILLIFFFILEWRTVSCFLSEFTTCHDDFSLKPPDGMLKPNTFGWLGFVQYIHVSTDLPHHSKAPRGVLIQKQFVLGTASDMLNLPKNYKLGNVVFGEYERDEEDCGMTRTQVKMGAKCPRAYIEIPIAEITPHPEYSRFGVGNSLALVKLIRPMKSYYMLPICMPSLSERYKQKKTKTVFLIDYISIVPRDFDSERMGKKSLRLYTHKECRRHRMKSKLGSEGVTHVLCTSGCGVRPGAPIIAHNAEGAFEIIGLAAGGAPCSRKAMRRRLIKEPPLYIDIYPYVNWMINVISAHELPLPYPQTFKLVEDGGSNRAGIRKDFLRRRRNQKEGWRARTYVSGDFCFKTVKKQRLGAFFYSEAFSVNAEPPAKMTVHMKISAGIECKILCARLLLPNRLLKPKIQGVGRYNISVFFSTEWFPYSFYYTLGLVGKNSSRYEQQIWSDEQYGLV